MKPPEVIIEEAVHRMRAVEARRHQHEEADAVWCSADRGAPSIPNFRAVKRNIIREVLEAVNIKHFLP